MAGINVAEITSILKQEIAGFQKELKINEVGTVIEVGDGIARIYGLRNAMAGELLEFENGVMGQVFNLEEDSVGAVIFGDYLLIKEGDTVKTTGRLLEVPVGDAVIGRVVNPLGEPLDGGPAIPHTETRKMDIVAPGIADRQPVKEPLQTGIKADRQHDPHRPRPARTDHRRPQDRQDRHRRRHDHQSKRQRGEVFLHRRRPEGIQRRDRRRNAAGPWGDGIHNRRPGRRRRSGADAVHRSLRRLRHGRILHVEGRSDALRL